MTAYYNDNDRFAVAWLGNLIGAGQVPAGVVDQRDIREVGADDVRGYRECHFFAGIGGWPLALRLAGWPVGMPVWTGSCPCQPYSCAGKQGGDADPRNLWPEFRRLIAECLPPVVLGEQVASKSGREWLSGVRADLEALGYAVGSADLCAAGAGAPHIRQRLYWVAHLPEHGCRQGNPYIGRRQQGIPAEGGWGGLTDDSQPCRVADSGCSGVRCGGSGSAGGTTRRVQGEDGERQRFRSDAGAGRPALAGGLGLADSPREAEIAGVPEGPGTQCEGGSGFWGAHDLVHCRDGRARRIEPGTFPLAHGVPARVGRLRGYGNAIVPPLAAVFTRSYLEAVGHIPVSGNFASTTGGSHVGC